MMGSRQRLPKKRCDMKRSSSHYWSASDIKKRILSLISNQCLYYTGDVIAYVYGIIVGSKNTYVGDGCKTMHVSNASGQKETKRTISTWTVLSLPPPPFYGINFQTWPGYCSSSTRRRFDSLYSFSPFCCCHFDTCQRPLFPHSVKGGSTSSAGWTFTRHGEDVTLCSRIMNYVTISNL